MLQSEDFCFRIRSKEFPKYWRERRENSFSALCILHAVYQNISPNFLHSFFWCNVQQINLQRLIIPCGAMRWLLGLCKDTPTEPKYHTYFLLSQVYRSVWLTNTWAHLELNLERVVKCKKKGFYTNTWMGKEWLGKMCSWWQQGTWWHKKMENAEVLNTFFTSVFANKTVL